MKCFSHQQSEAIGLCVVCMRGLCADCAEDLTRGLACKSTCVVEARQIIDLRDFSYAQPAKQENLVDQARHAYKGLSLFLAVTGIAMLLLAFLNPTIWAFHVLAGILLVFGIGLWVIATRLPHEDRFRLCGNCGFNISRSTTNECSECGHTI